METYGRSYKAWDTVDRGYITVTYYKSGAITVRHAGSAFSGHAITREEAKEYSMENPRYMDWKFAGNVT